MPVEVDNLSAPYNSICIIKVWFSDEDYQSDVNHGFSTFTGGQGTGVFIGANDVLTASHVLYDSVDQRVPYRIEVTPAYDSIPGEGPYGSFRGSDYALFTGFDPNHDGEFLPGDGNASTFSGAELDMAVIKISNPGNAPVPPAFALSTTFSSGSLNITGYPASYNGNPEQVTGAMSKAGVDNAILTNSLTMGPGSSGSPGWAYVNGRPTVFGVVSTGAALSNVAGHAKWIQEYIRLNGDVIGSSAADIIRPDKAYVLGLMPQTALVSTPWQYIDSMSAFLPSSIDGRGGVDTIALPWSSTNSSGDWGVEWTKAPDGTISGYLVSGTTAVPFTSIERLAFSNLQYDLTGSVVGASYQVGTHYSSTVVTSLDTSTNPIVWGIFSVSGDTGIDDLLGGEENDRMFGFDGDDTLTGFAGNDSLDGGTGADDLQGGDNFDVVSYLTAAGGLTADLGDPSNNTGDAEGDIYDSVEGLEGSEFSDLLGGDIGSNSLAGAKGSDILDGGRGRDTLTGGRGKDSFVFDTRLSSTNRDTITDFVHNKDWIELDDAIFKRIGETLNAREFYAKNGATKAHDSSDRIIYDKKTGKLFYDDDGDKKGGHDPILFATVANKAALDYGDFLVV